MTETCKIDHDSPDATVPRELCRICTPVKPSTSVKATIANMTAPPGEMTPNQKAAITKATATKDPRIPKGMSVEEGNAMLERRAAEKKEKTKKRVEAMLKEKADADAVKLDEINLKRKEKGLEPLESLDQVADDGAQQTKGPAATKESNVSKKAKSKRKATTKAKAKKTVNGNGVREGSKAELIAKMLKRPNGCTTKEVLKATGWPTVSMPAQAAMAGLKLRKEKTDKGLRYYAAE